MVAKTGDKAYFVQGSPRGLVLRPKNSAGDDHITACFDDGKFSQIHRKVNGHGEWRVTPELVQAEVDGIVANNVRPVEFGSVSKPGTFIVSVNRIRVLFAVPQALAGVAMPFLWRLIATKRLVRSESGTRMELSIERRKLRHLAARKVGPLSALGRLLAPPAEGSSPCVEADWGGGHASHLGTWTNPTENYISWCPKMTPGWSGEVERKSCSTCPSLPS